MATLPPSGTLPPPQDGFPQRPFSFRPFSGTANIGKRRKLCLDILCGTLAWGGLEEKHTLLDGRDLREYEGAILKVLRNNSIPEESGIMRRYDKDDSASEKVKSMFFSVEERNGQLWGVAECMASTQSSPITSPAKPRTVTPNVC